MAKLDFQLTHGIPFGKGADAELQYEVVLRELTTGDVIDARSDAEQVVFVPDSDSGGTKAITVVSEVKMGIELLRRQIASVGVIHGPLTMGQIRQFHIDDFELVNEQAEKLDSVLEVAAKRGRVEEPSDGS